MFSTCKSYSNNRHFRLLTSQNKQIINNFFWKFIFFQLSRIDEYQRGIDAGNVALASAVVISRIWISQKIRRFGRSLLVNLRHVITVIEAQTIKKEKLNMKWACRDYQTKGTPREFERGVSISLSLFLSSSSSVNISLFYFLS